ncbi:MAG TPA: alanyl-tRNA editing protein [Thermoanaerobaculia bacterium]|nr:alanyl-tRNA editing protein [Thermoanaerobaculia bacterium]HUM29278.1 alanyl-tRNA editing protein [Thermoanaerobaculia bacterium]HXK67764.1 alanyl-tRNA editing protein [Thermoanaerobaculia bacterium]
MDALFYQNPEAKQLTTKIITSGKDERGSYVTLDETLFYPEGGGQPGDRGTINGAIVTDTQKIDEEIRHYVNQPIPVGPCECHLDWPRRFRFMQHHTAQHLLTVLADRIMGWRTLSFHLGEAQATLDLGGDAIEPSRLEELEDLANSHILKNLHVSTRWVTGEEYQTMEIRSRLLPEGFSGQVRIVSIEDLDQNTCGGLHVASLGQVQLLRLRAGERIKGGRRVLFWAGGSVLQVVRDTDRLHEGITEILGCGPSDYLEALSSWQSQRQTASRTIRKLHETILHWLHEGIPVSDVIHLSGGDPSLLSRASEILAEKRPGSTLLLIGDGEETVYFLVIQGKNSTRPASELFQRVLQETGGRGGGRDPRYQGKSEGRGTLDRLLSWASTWKT